ncbi:hypothetical protein TNCV_897061 [Trichonephila clavipes]|nr:hypothetical protein TNCV_897061 [Trichonephila clavipes]
MKRLIVSKNILIAQCLFKLISGPGCRRSAGSLSTGGSKEGLLDPVKSSLSGALDAHPKPPIYKPALLQPSSLDSKRTGLEFLKTKCIYRFHPCNLPTLLLLPPTLISIKPVLSGSLLYTQNKHAYQTSIW